MNSNFFFIILIILMLAALSGCGPSTTQQGTSDIYTYRPVPGVVCFSKSARTLACLYEVKPIETLIDGM